METRNSARFCAKYVKFVGIVSIPRNTCLVVNGVKFKFSYSSNYKVGEVVHIAVRIPSLRSEPEKWSIHQIKLAETFYHYQWYEQLPPKQKRMCSYEPVADTHFKRNTYIIEKM